MSFTLFVDADSLPLSQRSILLKRIKKNSITAFFVADRELEDVNKAIEEDTADLRRPLRDTLSKSELRKIKSKISMVVVPSGKDSADNYIFDHIQEPALCITHDIPLSERVVSKGCIALDDRGNIIDKENARERLSIRNAMYIIRESGYISEKQRRINNRDIEAFANSLDKILTSYNL